MKVAEGSVTQGILGYTATCRRCPEEDELAGVDADNQKGAVYHGESYRTPMGRFEEHIIGYRRKEEGNFLWNHTKDVHGGILRGEGGREEEGRADYEFNVTKTFRDPSTRIVDEAIRIKREESRLIKTGGIGPLTLLNTKEEFYTSKDVRMVFTQL